MTVSRLIDATRDLEQPPERIYAFLADLRNHWRLSRSFAELRAVDGDGAGGRVLIRGPLGLRRVARAAPLDRAILLLGGRWILRRGLHDALEQLGRIA